MCNRSSAGVSITFKIVQLMACVTALIYKKVTDNQANMTFRRNQKISNEWTLLQNVNWSQEGNDFSVFTYAGYTFIIAVCLMERMINFRKLPTTTDTLFLRFGVIIFCLQAILVFYTFEYVHENLRLNALVLGGLTFVVALLFFLEDCCTAKDYERDNKFIQTEAIVEANFIHTH
ncbi:uncharacterized protein LOC106089529 isoform X2 [Stomoxys calcitrans]|uniref:uncharacterized protein LOC106089529 isoform X2 n=1 Tax=Stomoxys calcitrans TaxID=35570 RepID=UPI0027E322C2|nr:uncharacterized protein LOC106089529 isoform X2 [Stomoxys calcitrans]